MLNFISLLLQWVVLFLPKHHYVASIVLKNAKNVDHFEFKIDFYFLKIRIIKIVVSWLFSEFFISALKKQSHSLIYQSFIFMKQGGGGVCVLFLDNKEGSCRDKMLIYIHVNMIFVYVHCWFTSSLRKLNLAASIRYRCYIVFIMTETCNLNSNKAS